MPIDYDVVLFGVLNFMASILSGCFGFGAALVLIVAGTVILPPAQIVALSTLRFVANNVALYLHSKGSTDWVLARTILVAGIPSAIVGALLLSYTSAALMKLILGALAVLYFVSAVLTKSGKTDADERSSNTKVVLSGVGYGFFSGLVGTGNVIKAALFDNIGLTHATFVSTMAVTSLGVNATKLFVYFQSRLFSVSDLPFIVAMIVGSLSGLSVGILLRGKLSAERFRSLVRVIILLLGFLLLYQGVIGYRT